LLAVFAAACGDDSEPTPEAFIREAERLDEAHEAVASPLREQLDAAVADLAPDAPVPVEAKTIFIQLADEEDAFADAIDDLDVPESFEASRDKAVVALRAEATFGRELMAGVDTNTTIADIGTALSSDKAARIMQARTDACVSIQNYANANEVQADFTCG
jgi:hypothetical protein